MKISYGQITELTGFTYRTIKRRFADYPEDVKPVDSNSRGANLFNSKQALRALYYDAKKTEAAAEEKLDITAERARMEKERADNLSLKNAILKKQLLPADQVEDIWTTSITAAKSKLLSIPIKIAPAVSGLKSLAKIESITRELITEILQDLAEVKIEELIDHDK